MHLLNGGGIVGLMVLLYMLAVVPLLEGLPAGEQLTMQGWMLGLSACWWTVHSWLFWPSLALFRLVCKLLALVVEEHIGCIRSTLHNTQLTKQER